MNKVIQVTDEKGNKLGAMLVWRCKKCGEIRSNKITHNHGAKLSKTILDLCKDL